MSHPQGTPRGMVAAKKIDVGAQSLTDGTTYLGLDAGIALSGQTAVITQAAGGLKLPAGIALSGKSTYLTANSTAALIIPTVTAKPATRVIGGICFVSSAGKQMLAFHSTGGTWQYVSKTSVLA